MELLRGFHLWLSGTNTMRCWSNVSVSDVGPGWYWEAVYYNFQKGPSCLSSASLSAKLAVLQLFVDTHRLFLPTDFSQTAWNEILCHVEILGSVRRTITSSHCRGFPEGHKELHKCCRYSQRSNTNLSVSIISPSPCIAWRSLALTPMREK